MSEEEEGNPLAMICFYIALFFVKCLIAALIFWAVERAYKG